MNLGRAATVACFVSALAACDQCGKTEAPSDAAPEATAPIVDAAIDTSPVMLDATYVVADVTPTDASALSCRLVYGPAEQPFRGPAALVVAPNELRLVANDTGKPRIFPVPFAAPPGPNAPAPAALPPPSSFVGMRWPACEMAGKWAYCQAAGGKVYRTTLGQHDTKEIAKSRASTRIAAAMVSPEHAALATLDTRHTTEGERLQAFITLDEGETTRLSDEGAGATVVRMVARGAGAVALYIDARTSMVPVHVRPMAMKGADLALADDTVVFVAGSPERAVDFGLVQNRASLFVLLPIARETLEFGMAAILIAEHPKEDVVPVWSIYPNGLDPAAIGGTVSNTTEDGYVARVRPAEREPGSPRVVELGKLDPAGTFRSLGLIPTTKPVTDVAIARDNYGALWVLYGDTTATFLERRVCPP